MEEKYRLPFATIIKLREDIAEVIIDNETELDVPMVERMHQILQENLVTPFSVLVNRLHSYSYTPEAQPLLGTIEGLHAIGEVTYSRLSREVVEMLADFPRKRAWNVRIFPSRQLALEWVTAQQDTLRDHDYKT